MSNIKIVLLEAGEDSDGNEPTPEQQAYGITAEDIRFVKEHDVNAYL